MLYGDPHKVSSESTSLIILKMAGWASEDDGGVSCCFLLVSSWRGVALLGASAANRGGASMRLTVRGPAIVSFR